MASVDSYDHQSGVHCGAAALRNVTASYGLNYSEPACFGIGGGPAFVLYANPDAPWVTFRTSPTWLERAFFERLGIPHQYREGDDFETSWDQVTGHVEGEDPVILFLDPGPLEYLPDNGTHVPPHVAVMVGYDDETVELSDGAMEARQEVPRSELAAAWTSDRIVDLDHEYLVVTRARTTEDGTDAVAAGLRQSATYMIEPLQVKRDARGPGEEGVPALRSFGDYLGTWPDLPEPARPVRAARRSIDEHGDGTAYRALFADSLAELGRRTGIDHTIADRMDGIAETWRTVATQLDDVLAQEEPSAVPFETAASLVEDLADREEELFADLRAELGAVDGRA